jgi:hypothetical protein
MWMGFTRLMRFILETLGLILLGIFLLWQLNWVVSMQVLAWQSRVADNARFTCGKGEADNWYWVSNPLTLKWRCHEK